MPSEIWKDNKISGNKWKPVLECPLKELQKALNEY